MTGKKFHRRFQHGRNGRIVRGVRDRHRNIVEEDDEKGVGTGIIWYFLGFSILLVAGLSFVNFRALPDMHSPITFNLPSLRGGMKVVDKDADGMIGLPARPPSDALLTVPPLPPSGAIPASPFSSMYDQPASTEAAPNTIQARAATQSRNYAAQQLPAAATNQVPHQRTPDLYPQEQHQAAKAWESSFQQSSHPKETSNSLHSLGAASQAMTATADMQATDGDKTLSTMAASGGGMAVLEGDSWLRIFKSVDAKEMTFGAWIYLPNVPVTAFPQSSLSMKTIASTKISGCRADVEHSAGWALFVHEWGTFNQQLRLSWTDHHLACNELFSETAVVPYDRWVLVGFTLSEARNSAQLIIDGKIVADTGKGLGSFAKASKRAPVSEADISHRKYADTGGSLIYGAHMAQANDMPHVQSHVFYGFLGDMRLFHTAPEDEAKLMKILRASAQELSAGLLPPYAISVRTSFELHDQAGQKALIHNLADSSPIVGEPTGSRHVDIKLFSEKPVHPFYRHVAGGNQPAPPVDIPPVSLDPLPSLSPEALEKTWTKEWVSRNGKAALHESQKKADIKAEQVRMAMAHTWRGYRAKAWGHDDLKPVSGNSKDWCKIGITLLDALTTLWLLDLKTEWDQAVEWLTDRPLPTPGTHGMHSTFEMSIRGLGGLLGAYALSKQQLFLDNARRLADALLHAFNTPSGMPRSQVDVGTGATKWHSWVHFAVLAEVTTVQVEMRYLSHLLGDDTYKRAADRAFDAVLAAAGTKGLVPIYLTQMDEVPRFGNKKISLGAMGDSYYEYLIKQWVQNGKTEDRLKNKWKDAMREMLDQLVRKTNGGLTYICEKDNNNLRHRMDHLACFVAGMLMMGARELPVEEVDPRWEPTATALTETCHEMYRRTPTGLSPEYVIFHPERSAGQDMQIPHDAPHNLLRPEAAEAMYYMHYYTGDPKYREWAGEMIDAFDRYSKAPWGYAAVRDVRAKPPIKRDDMESFWGAETLKYLYLIQAPRNKLSMEEFVFNTEAHPMTRWQGG